MNSISITIMCSETVSESNECHSVDCESITSNTKVSDEVDAFDAFNASSTLLEKLPAEAFKSKVKEWKSKHPCGSTCHSRHMKFTDFIVDGVNYSMITYLVPGLYLFVDRIITPILKEYTLQISAAYRGNNLYPKFSMYYGGGSCHYLHRLVYAIQNIITQCRPFTKEEDYIYTNLVGYEQLSKREKESFKRKLSTYCKVVYAELDREGMTVDHINRDCFNAVATNVRKATPEVQRDNREKKELLRTKIVMDVIMD